MATSLFDKVLPIAKAAGASLRPALPVLGAIALLTVAGGWVYAEFFDEAPETFGQLVVDSPEIYTRERLVNDRFVEDAWLRRKLRASDTADFRPTGSLARRDSSTLQLAWGAEVADAASEPAAPHDAARRDAQALFRSELTYRGDIRNLIIENQLDDRHDLRGNSLYRLKFDASVLPGDNTRANALISVTLEKPPRDLLAENDLLLTAFDPDELKRWRALFDEWLRDIDENINEVMEDLKYDYASQRLSLQYFVDLYTTMQKCTDFDRVHYNTVILPAISKNDYDLIRASVDFHREKLGVCTSSADQQRSVDSAVNDLLTAIKSESEDVSNIDDADNPDEEETTEISDVEAKGKLEETERTPKKARRRYVKVEKKDKSSVSLNELLNRFAVQKLFQLNFGKGTTEGSESSGSVEIWNFFDPYAALQAFYRKDESAFRILAAHTTLNASPIEDKLESSCGGGFSVSLNRNHEFCLKVEQTKSSSSGNIQLFLSRINISQDVFSDILLNDSVLKANLERMIENNGESITIVIETGLYYFIRNLQRSKSVFSYAVTPKQAMQSLVVDEQTTRRGTVAAGANGLGGQLGGDRSLTFSGVREQPLVVGFGNALGGGEQSDAKIEFGWFISPPVQGADGAGLHKAHAAAQYALTALVSVPAWWDEIDLKVKRAWVDQHGNRRPATSPDETGASEDAAVTIDLPRDLESINASLFRHSAGPEIEEGKMEPIELTVCRKAAILLPGRRLWRSAVVTLGAQTADEIHVLPNMRGIIAKFDQIEMPSGWSDLKQSHPATVTVWTSEGSDALRSRAQLSMPSVAPDGKGMLYPNGTCQPEP